MKVLHISAECYPAAKAGGLGDVVGALPKYLNELGFKSGAVIPKYHTKWVLGRAFTTIFKGTIQIHDRYYPFSIQKENGDSLGFPLFVADIPGLFDRSGVYADQYGYPYGDEVERSLCFQQAVLQWIVRSPGRPSIIHCHDHHTGLVPFMMKYCPDYQDLKNIPTVFTIHNGEYHGNMGWDRMFLLPHFVPEGRGMLDWYGSINPLACAVKCAWRVTTVSQSYMYELMDNSNGMETLLLHEQHKSMGIINGIDAQVWDPATDPLIEHHFTGDIQAFKSANKEALKKSFDINFDYPLFTFIGRLVGEKGADLLPSLIGHALSHNPKLSFALLGTGDPELHKSFMGLKQLFPDNFDPVLAYNEQLAHQLYAGSDFILMPSRVEPCGLNQMYAMRYGTIPIVREVGGLKDSVVDLGEDDGRGVRFRHFSVEDAEFAIYRANELYRIKAEFEQTRERIMHVDFSWENAALNYIDLYNQML